ncbi:hypothetical protein FJT64_003799 [Amphibalanus amphitrite]|uniref:Uncharacterized protein n=1 Tax=Amphibalanus amphitrite TaxID=1232801 RepID=A0A6A4W7D9_AMPAM|nr:hypothetical protein FJT64_003799 [Amphibalanus amphitrite]
MAGCVLFVFIALSEYVIVIRMIAVAEKNKKKRAERDPPSVTHVRPIRVNGDKVAPHSGRPSELHPKRSYEGIAWDVTANRLEKLARYSYPVLFLGFNVIFWCYYLFKDSRHYSSE